MYKIVRKKELNSTVTLMEIEAPLVSRRARPGQFIILRVDENGERIPLTIADYNKEKGTITIVFQIVGATTSLLNKKKENDYICDFVGPLGNPTNLDNLNKVLVVAGGVGSAIALPIIKELNLNNKIVDTIAGFRNKDLVIFNDEFKKYSNKYILVSDDGSIGEKGNVTMPLDRLLKNDKSYDQVICIGPLIMMKFVSELTKKFNVKTIVSMNPIMIDGTGMCGGCRLTVDGKIKFACVDGPDFDGHLVDFDEVMSRNKTYGDFENKKREEVCKLLKG